MGYTRINAQGLSAPPYFLSFLITISSTFLADRWQQRGYMIMFLTTIGGIGYILLAACDIVGVRYFGVFLAAAGISFTTNMQNRYWHSNNRYLPYNSEYSPMGVEWVRVRCSWMEYRWRAIDNQGSDTRRGVSLLGLYTALCCFPWTENFSTVICWEICFASQCIPASEMLTPYQVGIMILNLIGQCGPLLGTNIFNKSDEPRYIKGMSICAAFTFFTGFLAFGLRLLLARENRKRDQEHGTLEEIAARRTGDPSRYESMEGEEDYGATFRNILWTLLKFFLLTSSQFWCWMWVVSQVHSHLRRAEGELYVPGFGFLIASSVPFLVLESISCESITRNMFQSSTLTQEWEYWLRNHLVFSELWCPSGYLSSLGYNLRGNSETCLTAHRWHDFGTADSKIIKRKAWENLNTHRLCNCRHMTMVIISLRYFYSISISWIGSKFPWVMTLCWPYGMTARCEYSPFRVDSADPCPCEQSDQYGRHPVVAFQQMTLNPLSTTHGIAPTHYILSLWDVSPSPLPIVLIQGKHFSISVIPVLRNKKIFLRIPNG